MSDTDENPAFDADGKLKPEYLPENIEGLGEGVFNDPLPRYSFTQDNGCFVIHDTQPSALARGREPMFYFDPDQKMALYSAIQQHIEISNLHDPNGRWYLSPLGRYFLERRWFRRAVVALAMWGR